MFRKPLRLTTKVQLLGLLGALLLILLTLFAITVAYFNEKRIEVLQSIPVYLSLEHNISMAPRLAKKNLWRILSSEQSSQAMINADPVLLNTHIRHSFYSGNIELFHTGSGTLYRFHVKKKLISMLDPHPTRNAYLYIFASALLFLLLLTFLYRFIRRSIAPIRRLSAQIAQYHRDHKLPNVRIEQGDEVGEAARTFYDLVNTNETLKQQRTLFTRNIIHELKTPLMQARIVTSSPDMPDSLRHALESSIAQQNTLLDELLDLESVLTDSIHSNTSAIYLIDVIEDVIDALDVKEGVDITYDLGSTMVKSDYRFLFLILKNLIDNAHTHAKQGSVISIRFSNKTLCVINSGEPLTHPIAYYYQPFKRETRSGSGMGLGLYIVKALSEKLGLELKYLYHEGSHRFCVRFKD